MKFKLRRLLMAYRKNLELYYEAKDKKNNITNPAFDADYYQIAYSIIREELNKIVSKVEFQKYEFKVDMYSLTKEELVTLYARTETDTTIAINKFTERINKLPQIIRQLAILKGVSAVIISRAWPKGRIQGWIIISTAIPFPRLE